MPSDCIPIHEITARISQLSWSSNWHISLFLAYFSVKGHGVPFLIVHKLSPRQYVRTSLKILVMDQHVAIKITFFPQVLAHIHTHTHTNIFKKVILRIYSLIYLHKNNEFLLGARHSASNGFQWLKEEEKKCGQCPATWICNEK